MANRLTLTAFVKITFILMSTLFLTPVKSQITPPRNFC